jgi:hypothetical protein
MLKKGGGGCRIRAEQKIDSDSEIEIGIDVNSVSDHVIY